MTDSPAAVDGRWDAATAGRRALEVAREEGARGLWFKLAGELGYRRLAIFELPLSGPLDPGTPVPALTVTELGEADRPAAERLVQLNPATPLERVEMRLEAGHRCFLAAEGERTVAACWVSGPSVPLPYLGFDLPLAGDEACTFETWTDPAGRGRGIGPALRLSVAGRLAEGGCTRLLAMIYPENRPAVRMVEKLGYSRIGTLIGLGPAGRRRPIVRVARGRRVPGEATG